jgi:hypothetical protein
MSDESPSECEYAGCTDRPTHEIEFVNPTETVVYCRDHCQHAMQNYGKAQSSSSL